MHTPEAAGLADLRAELDRIDDALHDLVMQRAAVVAQVAARKTAPGRLRPGREAAIIRRLLGRHQGPLPAAAVARVWRELLAGAVALQGPFSVAIAGDLDLAAVAREQFGALTPLRRCASAAAALSQVSAGQAAVAVLGLAEADWWRLLLEWPAPGLHVVARLPVWRTRPVGAVALEAVAVAVTGPDPSGDDRTLLALPARGAAAVLAHAGLRGGERFAFNVDATPWVVAVLDGFIGGDDPRLATLTCDARVLGAYACPIG